MWGRTYVCARGQHKIKIHKHTALAKSRAYTQVTYEIAYKNTPVQNFISYFLSLISYF